MNETVIFCLISSVFISTILFVSNFEKEVEIKETKINCFEEVEIPPLLQLEPVDHNIVQLAPNASENVASDSTEATMTTEETILDVTEKVTEEKVSDVVETSTTEEETSEIIEETEKIISEVIEEPKSEGLKFNLSEDDVYLLAQIIECETGNSNRQDMSYAGSVVLNRMRTNYRSFRDLHTIRDVLYQGYGIRGQQYATSTIKKIENGIVPSQDCLEVARGLADGTISCLEESILYQTGFTPSWDVEIVDLPGANEVYSRPLDFEKYK